MKRVLFTANLESFFTKFLIPQLKYFKELGYEVSIAAKLEGLEIPYCDKKYDVDFARGFNLNQNIKSYKQMKKIFKNEEYDIISCHTPFGGAVTRLAFRQFKKKTKTKMVYTAHGFHFYKGASKLNWMLFYTSEKLLAKYTDTLITINLEDYEIARKKFKTDVKYIHGIGLDKNKFDFKLNEKEKKELRRELNIEKTDYVLIYPAELLPRKRQTWLIQTLSDLLKKNPDVKLLLPGKDSMNGTCQKLVEQLNLQSQIKFLGFRKDIPKILKISNLAVSSSKQEGLPVNIMEAIYVGIPIVATDCRGNRDLITNGKNGYVVDLNDQKEFCNKVMYYKNLSKDKLEKIKQYNQKKIQQFLLDDVMEEIIKIYLA